MDGSERQFPESHYTEYILYETLLTPQEFWMSPRNDNILLVALKEHFFPCWLKLTYEDNKKQTIQKQSLRHLFSSPIAHDEVLSFVTILNQGMTPLWTTLIKANAVRQWMKLLWNTEGIVELCSCTSHKRMPKLCSWYQLPFPYSLIVAECLAEAQDRVLLVWSLQCVTQGWCLANPPRWFSVNRSTEFVH